MKFGVSLLLLLLVTCTIEWSHARRSYSSGGSRSRGYSSGRRTSHRPSTGGSHSHSTSHSGSTSHGTSFGGSTSHGTTTGGSSSPSHSPSAATPPRSNPASSPSQTNKDATHTFLHAEGGGASRPASAPTGPFQPSGNNPTLGSNNGFGPPSSYPHSPSSPYQPGRPSSGPVSSSPHIPSAPPAEHVPKVTSATTQNQGNPSYPAWGNPHLSTSNTGMGSNSGKPPINPPYPVSGPYNPHSNINPTQRPPYPVNGHYHPFPSSNPSPNPPYPVNGPYHPHPSSSAPYPGSGSGGPFTVGSSPFGHSSYPGGAMPSPSLHFNSYSPPPLGNPYTTHYSGSAYHGPAQPQYAQPQMLAQPAAQPFVPGQTVIMMPGQQDSGRGLGQIFKEALVFSTVNAAVNRVINPHHHYVTSESRPADSTGNSAPTTHITYNNQYFNTYPNGTVEPVQPGAVPPMNPGVSPMTPGGAPPAFSGAGPVPVVPAAAGAVATGPGVATGSAPGTGGTVGVTAPGVPPSGVAANPQVQGTPGMQASESNVPVLPQYRITDDDLYKVSEELFAKQAFNLSKYVTLNLQNRSAPQAVNVTDVAPEPLFFVQPELLDYPSVYVTRSLYDNYEFDSSKKETRSIEKRKEENLLLDTFLETSIMSHAMQWLANQRFVDPDDFERKDTLRHIWFNQFDGTTSGFERVFAAEKYGNVSILGVQDWLYFDDQEAKNRINYMGYVDKLNLGDSAQLIKLNFKMDDVIRPNATIFVGTLPELEMALYTICFYARPNNVCPVSLGGVKFNVFTHTFRYFGNDLIDLALPMF